MTALTPDPVPEIDRVARVGELGWRLAAALLPWGLLLAAPVMVVRVLVDPSLVTEAGLVTVFAGAVAGVVRWSHRR